MIYPTAFLLDTGCGDTTHNHLDLAYVAQDSVTGRIQDAAVFPGDGSGPSTFTPALQREDGSYIGSAGGYNYLMAMGASGGILWQKQMGSPSTPSVPVQPLYATADGGAIFTTTQPKCAPGDLSNGRFGNLVCTSTGLTPLQSSYGQLGTMYTADQSGNPDLDANNNPIPPAADTGARMSWLGNWYVDPPGTEGKRDRRVRNGRPDQRGREDDLPCL